MQLLDRMEQKQGQKALEQYAKCGNENYQLSWQPDMESQFATDSSGDGKCLLFMNGVAVYGWIASLVVEIQGGDGWWVLVKFFLYMDGYSYQWNAIYILLY